MPSRTPYGDRTGIHLEWVAVRHRTLWVLTVSFLALGAAGLGLYWWFTSGSLLGQNRAGSAERTSDTEDSARFIELNGTVKVRISGSYEWVDANRDLSLHRNDTVRTVGKSSARIRLFDGTEYLVKPDTIFMIEVMHEDPRTRVRQVAVKLTAGQVNLQTPIRNVKGSRSELATPTTEASFDERTVADVAFDESSQVTDLAVFQGSTRLRAGGQEVKLETRQAVEIRGEVISEIVNLPGIPVLESPAHLSHLVHANPDRENTMLRWRQVSEARRYLVELDRTPNFTEPQEFQVRRARVAVPGLRPGAYFWRVRSIDADKREGGFSNFAKFTITRRAAELKAPPLRLSQPTVSYDGLVTVEGITDPDAVVEVNDKRVKVNLDGTFRHYFTIDRPGQHPVVVKAYKRGGGTAEKTVYASIGTR